MHGGIYNTDIFYELSNGFKSMIMKMTKEQAKLIHLKAVKYALEEQLDNAETVKEYSDLINRIDTIDHHIQVTENYISGGFKTKVTDEITVRSSIHSFSDIQ